MSADDSSWDELSLATYAAASLPQISASELRHCLRHRQEIPLASCVHLSNPATGSTSLADAFRGEAVFQNITSVDGHKSMRRNVVFPLYLGKTGRDMMHSHALSIPAIQRMLRRKRMPPARCFIMTLRDPAARLQSAFRDSYVHSDRFVGSLAPSPRANRTAAHIIAKLRRAKAFPEWELPHHVDHAPQAVSGTAYLYAHSAGQPQWLYDWHSSQTRGP